MMQGPRWTFLGLKRVLRENLRSSKLSLHVSIDASQPQILTSEHYWAFFGTPCICNEYPIERCHGDGLTLCVGAQ